MKLPHLASRIFNTPLLVHPQKLDAIIAGLSSRIFGAEARLVQAGDAQLQIAPEAFSTRKGGVAERGYQVVDGVAVLNINGALVHRSRFEFAESTFILGYNDLAADLEDAMGNPDIHAVLQVYDSPGGEVQGAFEFARRVFDLRGRKPMTAIADGMACSAAYLGASAVDEVAVTATGYAGSIGVVARHVDFSRALDSDGVAVTHIFAGAHKVDGNPFEPLPATVRAAWQAEIDGLYTMFVDAVALHRRMDASAVRGTQAAVYAGAAALGAGLADRVATTDQLISELAARRARSYPVGPNAHSTANDQGASMSGIHSQANPPGGSSAGGAAPPAATFTQADLDRAATQARAEGREEGARASQDAARQEGAAAERERVSGIFAHAAAADRTALAIQCVTSGLSVDQAGAILAAEPAAPKPGASGNAFAAAMGAIGNPDVSGIESGGNAASAEADLAGQVITLFRAAR